MPIQEGEKIPAVTVKTEDMKDVTTEELFGGKKVVLFAVPGAFTPTCSAKHLPGFVNKAADLKAKGVDTIACVSVNDAFVMDAWGKDRGVGEKIVMLADGSGDYTAKLGLELDASGFGLGTRGKRFSLIVNDGVAEQVNVDEGGYDLTSAEKTCSI